MLFSVEPNTLDFPFNEINPEDDYSKITYTKTIKLRNTSGEKCRFSIHILQEQTDFKILQVKVGAVFPGKYEKVIIHFSPKIWKISQAIFYVKASKSQDLIPVTITAFPHLGKLRIPKGIDFGHAVLYEPKEKILTIENDIPVDFQFDISLSRELPPNYFYVSPMRGVIRGLEKLNISISFIPLTLCQAQMYLIFRTSEYNFKPFKCLVFGSGILEIPTELPAKQILHPITTKKITVKSPNVKKEANGAEPVSTLELELEPARHKSIRDLFTAELESNIAFIRKSELHRFVSIGKETPLEITNDDAEYSSRPMTGSRLSTTPDSSTFKVEVPSGYENFNMSQALYDRNGNRLLQLFLKAIYKVIFRIRAKKRIKILKEYLAGVPRANNVAPAAEKKDEKTFQGSIDNNLASIDRKWSIMPVVKKVIYPVTVPALPDLIKPRPISLLEPSYAEKQGFTKLPLPEYDTTFDINVPKLLFEQTKNEPTPKKEGDNQPTIPEIEVSTYEKVDLYNAIPGVSNVFIPHLHTRDESSPHYILRTSSTVDISTYPGLSSLEQDLKCATQEFGVGLISLFQNHQ